MYEREPQVAIHEARPEQEALETQPVIHKKKGVRFPFGIHQRATWLLFVLQLSSIDVALNWSLLHYGVQRLPWRQIGKYSKVNWIEEYRRVN